MDHNKKSKLNAEPKKNKPMFVIRVLWISDQAGVLIQEYGGRFFERNTMFFPVLRRFSVMPLEYNGTHGV